MWDLLLDISVKIPKGTEVGEGILNSDECPRPAQLWESLGRLMGGYQSKLAATGVLHVTEIFPTEPQGTLFFFPSRTTVFANSYFALSKHTTKPQESKQCSTDIRVNSIQFKVRNKASCLWSTVMRQFKEGNNSLSASDLRVAEHPHHKTWDGSLSQYLQKKFTPKTATLLEENIFRRKHSSTFSGVGLDKISLDKRTSKAQKFEN